ncbi:hypothetical protein AB4090_13145 [Acidithiobacillus sp. IBUN Pt1247-S3]|uniref:hypothetical protein n=1 Tax=Acidithiobacillus sp. IBUN Pt1247-S3 TaxID=3166642 RepID=UPI0034E4CBC0
MDDLKTLILAAQWAGYHWAESHPNAKIQEVEQAAGLAYPGFDKSVLYFSFHQGWVLHESGSRPQELPGD